MTQAVKEEVMVEIRYDIFDTIEALSYMLLSSWKASSEFTLDLKLNEDELASLVARKFLCSEDTKATRRIWGFELGMEWKKYRERKGLATNKSFKDRTNKDALSVATKAADSLAEIMDEVTITLWGWHERLERTRIMRAEHKATAKNLKSKKKQNEMQENIAKTEKGYKGSAGER